MGALSDHPSVPGCFSVLSSYFVTAHCPWSTVGKLPVRWLRCNLSKIPLHLASRYSHDKGLFWEISISLRSTNIKVLFWSKIEWITNLSDCVCTQTSGTAWLVEGTLNLSPGGLDYNTAQHSTTVYWGQLHCHYCPKTEGLQLKSWPLTILTGQTFWFSTFF